MTGSDIVWNYMKIGVKSGTSVTLLGLLSYDYQADSFEMTELSTLFAGGVAEFKRALSERIAVSESKSR